MIMIADDEEEQASDNRQAAAAETSVNPEETANDEEFAWQLQVCLLLCLPIKMAIFATFTALCTCKCIGVKFGTVF